MRKVVRYSIALIVFGIIITSMIPVDRETKIVSEEVEFQNYNAGNSEMYNLVKMACYDCHSYETEYPWYSRISPGKFIVQDHIVEGREHLNFSEWGEMSLKDRNHALEECAEELQEKEMPLTEYTWLHSEAKLTDAQRAELADYFISLMK